MLYEVITVVMAAGAIGTAQILLLSGLGPADELKAAGVEPLLDVPRNNFV